MRASLLIGIAVGIGTLVQTGNAQATCTGGTSIKKGNFGVLINGPAATGGGEFFVGLLTSDGKCRLTGSLAGGISGLQTVTPAVTGTYSSPANGLGSMSFSSTPLTFTFSSAGDEVFGIQTDGSATATIDLLEVKTGTYTNASLQGVYANDCFGVTTTAGGVSNPVTETDIDTFDGAGNVSGTGATINASDGGLVSSFGFSGS